MSNERFKNIIKKAFSTTAIGFSMGILFYSITFSLSDIYIKPVHIVKIWIAFFIIGLLSVVRLTFGETNWCRSKPFYVKNLIFMPLYLLTALILVIDIVRDMGVSLDLWMIGIYIAIFVVTFTIRQLVEYFLEKAKTDKMNDALKEFQKEHSWDEEE